MIVILEMDGILSAPEPRILHEFVSDQASLFLGDKDSTPVPVQFEDPVPPLPRSLQ